jgi:hypothetical protein
VVTTGVENNAATWTMNFEKGVADRELFEEVAQAVERA